jgi:hypothetical protein
MRKYIVFTFICLNILSVVSQSKIYSNNANLNIDFDFKSKTFCIYYCWPSLYSEIDNLQDEKEYVGESVEVSNHFSEGKFNIHKDIINCYDPKYKRTYLFRILDKLTIISIKNTAHYFKGEILKVNYLVDQNSMFESYNWKNWKKNGICHIKLNDSIVKILLYKDDIIIDSVFFNSESQQYETK